MKQTIKLNESKLNRIVMESMKKVLNEGPGAGYEIRIDGLQLDQNTIKITKKDDEYVWFEANIKPCKVDRWEVEDYYNMFSSDEYGNRSVQGGFIVGVVCLDDVKYSFSVDTPNEIMIKKYISETDIFTHGLYVKYMYGGGYIHSDLEDTFELGDSRSDINSHNININGEDEIYVIKTIVDAPNMAVCINYTFEHIDDEFDETEEENGEEVLKESVRKALKKLLR